MSHDTFDRINAAMERAKAAGTLNADDRSKQYPLDEPEKVKKAVNEAWSKIHRCEKKIGEKDAEIAGLHKQLSRYRFLNIALTSIITALAVKGLELIAAHFFLH